MLFQSCQFYGTRCSPLVRKEQSFTIMPTTILTVISDWRSLYCTTPCNRWNLLANGWRSSSTGVMCSLEYVGSTQKQRRPLFLPPALVKIAWNLGLCSVHDDFNTVNDLKADWQSTVCPLCNVTLPVGHRRIKSRKEREKMLVWIKGICSYFPFIIASMSDSPQSAALTKYA